MGTGPSCDGSVVDQADGGMAQPGSPNDLWFKVMPIAGPQLRITVTAVPDEPEQGRRGRRRDDGRPRQRPAGAPVPPGGRGQLVLRIITHCDRPFNRYDRRSLM